MRKTYAILALLVLAACEKKAPPGAAPGELRVVADEKGFHPSSIDLVKGGPGTLTFVRTTDDTCAKEVVFEEIGVKKALPLNVPVTLDVPTDKGRTIAFTCGMGMFASKVVVR
jgi:plastocyanin domain-containing protein